jgi:hypothetical protein
MNVRKLLGCLAVAGSIFVASPTGQANAASLLSPGAASAIQLDTHELASEVRWRHRGWRHHRWHRLGLAAP